MCWVFFSLKHSALLVFFLFRALISTFSSKVTYGGEKKWGKVLRKKAEQKKGTEIEKWGLAGGGGGRRELEVLTQGCDVEYPKAGKTSIGLWGLVLDPCKEHPSGLGGGPGPEHPSGLGGSGAGASLRAAGMHLSRV